MTKQNVLAALTAVFVFTGASMASAESGVSSAASDEGSSAQMEADYAATNGVIASTRPRASLNSYGYANHHHVVVTKHNH